jgi:hypothetical protein
MKKTEKLTLIFHSVMFPAYCAYCTPCSSSLWKGKCQYPSSIHSVDGRRRDPNASCPSSKGEEGASICEKYHTSLPEYGGLETHPDGGPSGSHQGLVYLPKLHPVTGASDGYSHPVTGSKRLNKKPPLRTTQPDTTGRVGGSQGIRFLKEGTPVS